MSNFIAEACISLRPEYGVSVEGDVITWSDNANDIPTQNEIDVEAQRLSNVADSNAYQLARKEAYPSLGDQLDMQYHDAVDGTTIWKDAIAQVKTDNPKPE